MSFTLFFLTWNRPANMSARTEVLHDVGSESTQAGIFEWSAIWRVLIRTLYMLSSEKLRIANDPSIKVISFRTNPLYKMGKLLSAE
tara:strand:+ start:6140 stop:6397 length:258 start_codon:yes stop_codon:yes gene_type:complete